MARFSRPISSVYVLSMINRFMFGKGVVISFIMTIVEEVQLKTNPIYPQAKRSAFRNLVYFVNSYRNHSAYAIFDRRYDNAFCCKIILYVSLLSITMADTDVINVSAVFLRSTALCFILTVPFCAHYYAPCQFHASFG